VSEKRPSAVVTGAGRGIGRAVALRLAERGFDVSLLARTMGELDETRGLVEAGRTRALVLPCDVSDDSAVRRVAAESLRAFGAPRTLVTCAGGVKRALVHEMSEADWDEVLDVNLKGTFLVARAFLPAMLEARQGRVVALASISSTLGTARQSAYAASKWGVVGFVKSLAEELRGTGVQAMAVMPGSVSTSMLEGSGFAPQMTPDDVAGLVVYAALDAPDAMNGSAVEIFGP
jgi:3-oxoacyl-[acyl-carrier protein] reductase